MSFFDGAKVCQRVGTYILNKREDSFRYLSLGFSRNDSPAVVKGLSGPEIEGTKKSVIKSLKIVD